MADYEKKYRLGRAPTARNDGSGCVLHDIWAIASVEGEDEWFVIPGRHKDIAIPASELAEVLAGPGVADLYRAALARNLNTQPVPITGWDLVSLEALLDNNDAAAEAAAAANEWLMGVKPQYPIDFSM